MWAGVHGLFGMSPVAFHALTLLLHVGISLAIWWTGRELMKLLPARGSVRRRAPLAAALVFAVHPLLTEGVNYAQNASLQFVTLFMLVSVAAILRLRSTGRLGWLAVAGTAVFLGGNAKEVGFFYVGGAVGLTVMLLVRRQLTALVASLWKERRAAVIAGGVVLAGLVVLFSDLVVGLVRGPFTQPMWTENFFTQGRVFWKYVALAVWPQGLCADHQIPLSGIGFRDPASLAGLSGVVALGVAALWASVRRRSAALGLVALLALFPLVARFLYVNKELMVEYRVYPAFPWVALLVGVAWAAFARRAQKVALPLGLAVLAGWTLISNARTLAWQDERTLALDVIRQYPSNIRARTALQRMDYEAGEYARVKEWRDESVLAFHALRMFNEAAPHGRKYEASMPWRGLLCTEHFLAFALAESQGSQVGLDYVNRVISDVHAMRPEFFDKDGGSFEIVEQLVAVQNILTKHGAEIDARRKAAATPARETALAVP